MLSVSLRHAWPEGRSPHPGHPPKPMKDPYEVLGVPRTASRDQIRRAYRERAKRSHPDLHPGDPKAEERFKEISAAWHLLSDKDRRARYDRGAIDAEGHERPHHAWYRNHAEGAAGARYDAHSGAEDLGTFSDLFAEVFGRAGGPRTGGRPGAGPAGGPAAGLRLRGADRHFQTSIDFLTAVRGGHQRVGLPGGATLDVAIPAGLEDGQVLRLRGKGDPGIGGGPAGDALVAVSVRPHRIYARDGDDIVVDVPVTAGEALAGGRIRVPTLHGPVSLTVPARSNTGTRLRLKGKGVQAAGRPAGDQIVRLSVALPERPDAALVEAVTGWEQAHPYDPRRRLMAEAGS